MLNNIRNFSKTITAKIFLFIVAVPFVFWGMGDVFTSGNTNSLAKINNKNISTQDFIDHINKLNINESLIKDRIDQNVMEEILSRLISARLLEQEIKEINLVITDKILADKIKSNTNFLDDKSNFSRTKYEKFLISNNLTANEFEKSFKENEFQEELFNFVGGGIKSPDFLIDTIYKDDTKQIKVDYINLENVYKKEKQFKNEDLQDYVEKNNEELKRDFIDFSYSKITPKNLIGIDEYNNDFFNKIDEIETNLLNQSNFNEIIKSYDLKSVSKIKYTPTSQKETIESKIYNLRTHGMLRESDNKKNEKKIIKKYPQLSPKFIFLYPAYNLRNNEKAGLIDGDEYFIIYKIENVISKVPSLDNEEFEKEIRKLIYNKKKFEFNTKILKQINEDKFLDSDFKKIASEKTKVNTILLESRNDTKVFNSESLELIYSLPIKTFTLVTDDEKNVYLIKIISHNINEISKDNEIKNIYSLESNNIIKNKIFQSYDVYLNSKYDIKINEKTLERVKNYFR